MALNVGDRLGHYDVTAVRLMGGQLMRTITSTTSTAAGLLALVAVFVVTGRVSGTQDTGPVQETVIYSSLQPPNWDLYLFERPGSTPRRLTTDPGLDYNGVISPDGRWVVFTSERTGNPDLYVLDLRDNGAARPLIESDAMEDAAAFSPDGRTLIFVSTRSGNPDIFVIPFVPEDPAAASEATNLTRHEAGDYNPRLLARRDADSLFQQPQRVRGDGIRGSAPGHIRGQRAVRDAIRRDRRAETHVARELGWIAGLGA